MFTFRLASFTLDTVTKISGSVDVCTWHEEGGTASSAHRAQLTVLRSSLSTKQEEICIINDGKKCKKLKNVIRKKWQISQFQGACKMYLLWNPLLEIWSIEIQLWKMNVYCLWRMFWAENYQKMAIILLRYHLQLWRWSKADDPLRRFDLTTPCQQWSPRSPLPSNYKQLQLFIWARF